MDNFNDTREVKSTERLLNAADYTELKIVIVLFYLPQKVVVIAIMIGEAG
jgi:hypothetical protein